MQGLEPPPRGSDGDIRIKDVTAKFLEHKAEKVKSGELSETTSRNCDTLASLWSTTSARTARCWR
jgi:hypothetical protein